MRIYTACTYACKHIAAARTYAHIYRRGNRRIWHFQFCSHCRVVEVIQSHGEHVAMYDRDSRNPHCRACARERSPVSPARGGWIFIGSHVFCVARKCDVACAWICIPAFYLAFSLSPPSSPLPDGECILKLFALSGFALSHACKRGA